MTRLAAASLVLLACGPSVGVETDESTTDETTTSARTIDGTTATRDATSGPDEASTELDENAETFIQNPDGGGFGTPCDVWMQDCYPDSLKCTAWAQGGGDEWNATLCAEVDPTPAAVGEPCVMQDNPFSGLDDCDHGAFCWAVDPVTLEGTCVALCSGGWSQQTCNDGLSCFLAFDGAINLCLPSCDPLAPSCARDEVCAHSEYGDPARFVCVPTPPFDPRAYGEPCEAFGVCADGFACVDDSHVHGCTDLRCCTVVGDLSQVTPVCPDATPTCIPFEDAVKPDGLCYCGVES